MNLRLTSIIVTAFLFIALSPADSQFLKKLKEGVTKSAEETIQRKAEQKAARKTEQAFDSVFNNPPSQQGGGRTSGSGQNSGAGGNVPGGGQDSGYASNGGAEADTESDSELEVYRKFDFVPGTKIMLFDDFSADHLGDFPSKWDTNGSGELVTFSGSEQKWFKLVNKSVYIPDLPYKLPEEFTIEFDVATKGLGGQTSSVAKLEVWVDNQGGFDYGSDYAYLAIPFCQYIDVGVTISRYVGGRRDLHNTLNVDLRQEVLEQPHFSIAVNKRRLRLWINERKVVDVPRLVPEAEFSNVKMKLYGLKEGTEDIFITNFKVAEGGLDLRHQLLSEGKFSTSGILFDVNSANIKPESYGVIKDIANVLNENPGVSVQIIGHTDADGDDDSNLALSQKRANAVRDVFVKEFGVSIGRMETEGKGETQPVADNGTATGKAKNRRVEFIKL